MREAIVIFLRGLDLPAHEEVHDEDYGDLFGDTTDVGEGAQDVGEEHGQWVGFDYAVREDERSKVGIMWADERLYGHALGGTTLTVLEEFQEDDFEGAGSGQISRKGQVSDHVGCVLGMLRTASVAGGRGWLLREREVGIDCSPLAVVEQEFDTESLVKGHIWLHERRTVVVVGGGWAVSGVAAQVGVGVGMSCRGIGWGVQPGTAIVGGAGGLALGVVGAVRGRGCGYVVEGGVVVAGIDCRCSCGCMGKAARRLGLILGLVLVLVMMMMMGHSDGGRCKFIEPTRCRHRSRRRQRQGQRG